MSKIDAKMRELDNEALEDAIRARAMKGEPAAQIAWAILQLADTVSAQGSALNASADTLVDEVESAGRNVSKMLSEIAVVIEGR